MKNEISQKLEYPTYSELIHNYKKESYWNKTWVIFRDRNVTVKIKLAAILAYDKKVVFTENGYYGAWTLGAFEVSLDDRITDEMFRSKLQRHIFAKINEAEKSKIESTEEYCSITREEENERNRKLVEFYNKKENANVKSFYTNGDERGLSNLIPYYCLSAYRDLMGESFYPRDKQYERSIKYLRGHEFKTFKDSYTLLLSLISNDDLKKELSEKMEEKQ